MSFFDTTPIGRILNRFAKEIDIMDVTIPMNFRMLLSFTFQVIGTLIAIIFALPIFIVVIIPIAFVFYFVQKFYVATARQVKRLESITRSPIYSHFGETLSGAATIRAYKVIHQISNEMLLTFQYELRFKRTILNHNSKINVDKSSSLT